MKEIEIKGLTVSACHGVLESEKSTPQIFKFDISLSCDTSVAAESDNVADTINYADVCAIVNDLCKSNCYNLIERLAAEAAKKIINSYPTLNGVQVTVHKPQAPIPYPFDDVSVTANVERNDVILSIGSSQGDKRLALDFAVKKLSEEEGVQVVKCSSYIQTEPYGGVAKNTFLNGAVLIKTTLSPQKLLKVIHGIEEECGRVRLRRWDDRTLDIDIVFFGNKIINEQGLCVPHPDYQNRAFVLDPIKEIAPNFVCPLTHKRLSDM